MLLVVSNPHHILILMTPIILILQTSTRTEDTDPSGYPQLESSPVRNVLPWNYFFNWTVLFVLD